MPTYGCKISASRSNTAMLTCCQGLHGVDVLLRLCGPAGGDEAVAAAVLRPAGGVRGEGEPRGIFIANYIYIYRYWECVAFFAKKKSKNVGEMPWLASFGTFSSFVIYLLELFSPNLGFFFSF